MPNCHFFTVCVCCTHVGLHLIPLSIHFIFWYGRYNLNVSAFKMPSLDPKISELIHVLKVDKASAAIVTFLQVFPFFSWYSWGEVSMGNITSWFLPLLYRKSPVFNWHCCILFPLFVAYFKCEGVGMSDFKKSLCICISIWRAITELCTSINLRMYLCSKHRIPLLSLKQW